MRTNYRSNGIEVGDIFRQYGPAYRESYPLGWQSLKAMSAIENCRTAALGGHVDECDECGDKRISYDSCSNRHCPKCQGLVREKWLAARQKEVLPVTYFHVVLTLPRELNSIALLNQKVVYDLLFKAGSETLMQLGEDPKHLGAEIGIIAVLHTWGQNLLDHPHLHCIVPGGGLSDDGQRWLYPKKSKKNKKFFVHVHVIGDLFKKKFLAYLKQAYRKGELKFVLDGSLIASHHLAVLRKPWNTLPDIATKWPSPITGLSSSKSAKLPSSGTITGMTKRSSCPWMPLNSYEGFCCTFCLSST
jgi:hypothetical protein